MASQRKSHVLRVTGLSRELTDGDLTTALQEAINDNFTDDEKSHSKVDISIVPSCYEDNTQRVALVQFRGGVPQFLDELRVDPLGEWQVEIGDTDINFDCHFFGFTQLYTLDENKPVDADIIAIAGLDGHAYGSWQGRGNLGRMWLRDFLSKDLPRCRTMIYGYNSKLSSHGVDTILDYGRELMEEIKKIRNTKELQQRPLVFIAHSFGGIIMAHCLVRAIQTMEEDHPAITSLHRATYGMILFAIPHKGLVMDDIQQMLAGDKSHPREQLLRQISSKSDVLIHQVADFRNLIRDRKVVSLYEMKQTRRLVLDSESGRWKRTGDFMTTVGADSALLQLPDHAEDKVPLHADHSIIVKFDKRDAPGYRTALDRLRQFSKDAPSVVAARFNASNAPAALLQGSAVRKRNIIDNDSETPKAKRARLYDSASSPNSEESDTTHYEDDNIFDDISQEKVYNMGEPWEESHKSFSGSLTARDATSEIGSPFRYGSSSREGSSSEYELADESDILEPDELSMSEESISSAC
ncbi:hypothetical protein E8E15_000969 [Penicillium rubens]|uniref:Protein SERAC1 n=1 Tax=Penicillium chrysogenum TaxID=5076 RepID=A0A167X3S3_PENCH|nr:uncharacterized protein N7525_002855 [Penicillium rubens]KAF3002276.1 hypothetical protein E8E15_000969 [Penicillium rubens]KAJ5837667.1 hypothetical protein N7525_002855 [Penicillium rubens]KZN92381.1 Protein SERAC1 [Penicillium chrysogenum]